MKKITLEVAIAGLILLSIAWPGQAAGNIFYVRAGADGDCLSAASPCGNIQQALDMAEDYDIIWVAEGRYTNPTIAVDQHLLSIARPVELLGSWNHDFSAQNPTAYSSELDAEETGRVIYINGPYEVTIEGFNIINGNAEGLQGHTGDDIFPLDFCATNRCDAGAGIYSQGATLTLRRNRIANNWVVAPDVICPNGSGCGWGGAVYINDGPNCRIEQNLITNNRVGMHGGGLFLNGSGQTVIRDNRLEQNESQSGGGAFIFNTTVLIQANQFYTNTAAAGGGLLTWNGPATIEANQWQGNLGRLRGGAIYIYETPGAIREDETEITANLFLSNGGHNNARGGAIAIRLVDEVKIDNNFFINNDVRYDGAGLWVGRDALNIQLRHNTFVGHNDTIVAAGDYRLGEDNAGLYLVNNLFAQNERGITTLSDNSRIEAYGSLWDQSVATFAETVYGTADIANTVIGTARFVDPGTPDWDYRLASDSAGIDAGQPGVLSTDFEGDPRPFGEAPDIGADENVSSTHTLYIPMVIK